MALAPLDPHYGFTTSADFDFLDWDGTLNSVVNQVMDHLNDPRLTCEVAWPRLLLQ